LPLVLASDNYVLKSLPISATYCSEIGQLTFCIQKVQQKWLRATYTCLYIKCFNFPSKTSLHYFLFRISMTYYLNKCVCHLKRSLNTLRTYEGFERPLLKLIFLLVQNFYDLQLKSICTVQSDHLPLIRIISKALKHHIR
jgi:hypothetical protein